MRGGRPTRWLSRIVVLATCAATLQGAFEALAQSRKSFRYARRHAGETIELAQDRLFGREYMAALRAVRARTAPEATLAFVDDGRADGSSYFALHYLAPRRLVRFPRLDDLPARRIERRLSRRRELVLVVPKARAPVRLVPASELRSRRERARSARP